MQKAERVLIEHAGSFAPRELRNLGRRILDVVAPEVGEDHERRRLEDEERKARRTTTLTTRVNGDGTTTIRIRVPDAIADRLMTYLHAWTNPRRTDTTRTAPTAPTAHTARPAPRRAAARASTPYPTRLGQAFCSLLEHLDPARIPEARRAPRPAWS